MYIYPIYAGTCTCTCVCRVIMYILSFAFGNIYIYMKVLAVLSGFQTTYTYIK